MPVIGAAADAQQGRAVSCRVSVVTEDGTVGRAERVSDTLQREIRPGDHLAVCGPWAMSEAVARVCRGVVPT